MTVCHLLHILPSLKRDLRSLSACEEENFSVLIFQAIMLEKRKRSDNLETSDGRSTMVTRHSC